MTHIKKFVDTLLQWISIVIVVLMTFFVTYQVVTRYIFNRPSAVSEALARYLFVWLTMLGGAYVFGKQGHMNITFFREKFSPKKLIILKMASEALIAVFALLIMFYGGKIYMLKQMISIEPSINIPMGYIYAAVPIGGILILFYAVYNETLLFKSLKSHGA
jgi:TRAP-type C4-dicarboxylate transport system permease small subunit